VEKKMKKLIFIILLLGLIFSAAWAEEKTKQVSSKSGRSTYSIPLEWYVSFESQYAFARAMPYETVVIADAQASSSLVTQNLLISAEVLDKDFQGALLVHTVLPAGAGAFVSSPGGAIEPDMVLEALADSAFKEIKPEKNTYKIKGLTATSYSIHRNSKVLEVQLIFDKEGNMLITLAVFAQKHAQQMKAIKESLEYTYYSREDLYKVNKNLTLPLVCFNGILEIKIPRGWWAINFMGLEMAAGPDLNYLFGFQKNTAAPPAGMFIMGYSNEDTNGSFKNLLKQDNITQEELRTVLEQLHWSQEQLAIDALEKWQSDGNVSGLSLVGKTPRPNSDICVAFKLFLMERQGKLCILACLMDEAGKDSYLPLIDAVMATARWLGE
jgi:hypothetical protein